jgi:predicted DNA-binding transcriptional regulator AlpA
MKSDPFGYPPRLMDRAEAARYLSVGITVFDEMVAEGMFPRPKKIKSKQVWDRIDLESAASAIPEDGRTVTQTMLDHYRAKRK